MSVSTFQWISMPAHFLCAWARASGRWDFLKKLSNKASQPAQGISSNGTGPAKMFCFGR